VGGGLPLAVGLALADKLQKRPVVTVCFFGDGAVAEGEFHESLNLAALWKLPVVFLLENNLYAMGTALERHQSRIDVHTKAAGYGIEAVAVDGMDVLAVQSAMAVAVEYARAGRPYFLECQTYRFRAHSMYDAELYRSKEEVEKWKLRDPIHGWQQRLWERDWLTESGLAAIEADVAVQVQAAVAFAENGPLEPVEDLLKHVYAPETP
jgi:TPP-dependent pyruvate/acetoin dehydrogenase alpha subunit